MTTEKLFDLAWKEWNKYHPSPELGWWEFYNIFKLGYEKGETNAKVQTERIGII